MAQPGFCNYCHRSLSPPLFSYYACYHLPETAFKGNICLRMYEERERQLGKAFAALYFWVEQIVMKSISTHKFWKKFIFITSIVFMLITIASYHSFAQPYIDLFTVRYISSPEMGKLGKDKNPTRLDYLNISATVPIQFNNKKDALVLTPFFEKWTAHVESVTGYSENYYGLVLPVSYIKSIPNTKWSIMTMGILRMNDAYFNGQSKWQLGGAILASKQVSRDLVYKLGVYLNADFFGLFVVPLVGVDWHINERTNLFGVLPASLTLEYKLAANLYTGSVFRTFTNSYYDTGPKYLRIDENELGLFLDYYPAKKVLLNVEVGHSILRKLRGGEWHDIHDNWDADNGMYFKLAVAYRFRLRN
jgi:Domain of unknown function (DUF6268)